MSSMQDNGRAFQRCLQCPAGSSADASSGACVPPSGPLRTAANDLAYVLSALNAKGAGISATTATQVGEQLQEQAAAHSIKHSRLQLHCQSSNPSNSVKRYYCQQRYLQTAHHK
jgi:hypothetical protein